MTAGAKQAGQISSSMLIGVGLVGVAGVAGAAYLALGTGKSSAPAQSNNPATIETAQDQAQTQNIASGQDVDASRADLSSGPDMDVPQTPIDWHAHYLVLLGENHLPVLNATATPFVSLFEVDPDYVPVSGFSNKKTDTVCGAKQAQTVQDGMNGAAAISRADEAVAMVGANSPDGTEDRPGYCPQDLGEVWGAGSYVFDTDYNQLAGQDFSESARIMKAAYLWFEQDFERTHGDPGDDDDVIVILEGGDQRSGDPAIKIADFYQAIIVDYPVLKREGDDPGGLVQGPGKTYAPPAPDLPVTVSYQVLNPADYDPNALQVPIALVEERITDQVPETSFEFGPLGEIVIVTRNIRAANAAEGLARANRIQDVFGRVYGSDVKIRTVSFGDEAPICQDDTRECWSLNRSTIAYFYPK